MIQQSSVLWCMTHPDTQIQQICLHPECILKLSHTNQINSTLLCSACAELTHEGHPLLSLVKFKDSLQKFMSCTERNNKSCLTKETQLSYLTLQNNMDCVCACISKLSLKLSKLAQFMDNLRTTLVSLEHIAQDGVVATLLYHLEQTTDMVQLNNHLQQLFLLHQVVRMPDPTTGKMDLTLTPSPLSLTRTHDAIDGKQHFTSQLRAKVDQQEASFESFLRGIAAMIKDNKELLIVVPKVESVVEPIIKKEETINMIPIERNGMADVVSSSSQQCTLKIANYFIFYETLRCDGIVSEPILRGKSDEARVPISCAFCRLVRIRSFVSCYFRFATAPKYGKLCLFRDRDIAAHEMCLLWSNRVQVDHTEVNLNSVVVAVQCARAQMCRYCGSVGASLKCNHQDCLMHYHYHCLRQVKLMGLQLDHENKYRFFCEDHVKHDYHGKSVWFITRIRMKHIIQQGGQPAFTKRHQQIDWSELGNGDDQRAKQQNI